MYFLQFQIFVEWDVILLKKNVFYHYMADGS